MGSRSSLCLDEHRSFSGVLHLDDVCIREESRNIAYNDGGYGIAIFSSRSALHLSLQLLLLLLQQDAFKVLLGEVPAVQDDGVHAFLPAVFKQCDVPLEVLQLA